MSYAFHVLEFFSSTWDTLAIEKHGETQMAHRYDYAGPYKTLARAEAALEDCYATGEVCEGEQPRIERRSHKTASWSNAPATFVITCVDWSAYELGF